MKDEFIESLTIPEEELATPNRGRAQRIAGQKRRSFADSRSM